MRLFITGGTGLIGRPLIDRLLSRGDEVICVSRDPGRARARLGPEVEVVGADPTLPGSWQDRLAVCDAVVNLAGDPVAEGRWTTAKKQRMRRSRLATTGNVARAAAGSDTTRVLISASAVGYYGNAGETALGEAAEPGQDFLARLAVEWEHTAGMAAREDLRVVLPRIGVVLASEGGALSVMLKPFRMGLGGPLGSGRQYFPWIHREDLVEALLFMIDTEAVAGPVNAVVPDPPRQKEFARALGRACGKSAIMPAPGFALRLLLGEKGEMLLAGQRAVPQALRARGFEFRYTELEPVLADLVGDAGIPADQA